MMNISLPNGKVISVSYYEWLFLLDEKDVAEFYQTCMAEDLGNFIENPFSKKAVEDLSLDAEENENNLQNYFENPSE